MSNQNSTASEDIGKDLAKKAGDPAKKAGKAVAKGAIKAVKKIGKKVAIKVAKAAVKVAVKAIGSIITFLAPYIGVIALILLVCIGAYYVVFEIRGSEQIYTYDADAENETSLSGDGIKKAGSDSLSGKNQAVKTFFNAYSNKSYYQIIGDDNTKLEQDTGVVDYDNKEQDYLLNSNILFALDETVFRGRFIYPEQFVKPVYYDPEKLLLSDLTDKKGNVVVESEERNKKGELTGKKVKSVADVGLGSIYKYKKEQKITTIEGTATKEDYWDEESDSMKQKKINRPFKEVIDTEEIHVMTKAVTFVGEFEFKYENKKEKMGDLADDVGKKNENVKKVKIGTIKDWDEHCTTKKILEKEVEVCVPYLAGEYPQYEYREGGEYEEVPVLKETVPNDTGLKYFNEYLYNFKAYIPQSVMNGFVYEDRIGDASGTMALSTSLEKGSQLGSEKYKNSLKQFSTIQKWADIYGVDPYIVLAQMAQESGGKNDSSGGSMQIDKPDVRTVYATNKKTGAKDSFTVRNSADRQDYDKGIRWGVMYLANLVDNMDGDQLKGLQSYNFDVGVIKKQHPEVWNTEAWTEVKYREEARLHYFPGTKSANYDCAPELRKEASVTKGDVCYLEHVLAYYGGDGGTATPEKPKKGIIDKIKDTVKQVLKDIIGSNYEKEKLFKPYKHFIGVRETEDILTLATAMEKGQLFSETESEDLLFWEEGFTGSLASEGKAGEAQLNLIPGIDGYTPPLNIKNPIVTSPFGWRIHPLKKVKKFHQGIDLGLSTGEPIYAVSDGKVTIAIANQRNSNVGYGNVVYINHGNGTESRYGHLDTTMVKPGQEVKRGQQIGTGGTSGGSTGPHLHFEIRINDKAVDPKTVAVRPNAFK